MHKIGINNMYNEKKCINTMSKILAFYRKIIYNTRYKYFINIDKGKSTER